MSESIGKWLDRFMDYGGDYPRMAGASCDACGQETPADSLERVESWVWDSPRVSMVCPECGGALRGGVC